MSQCPVFVRYTRNYLHQVTGFSLNYLCRIATGRAPLSRSFIERCCFALTQPEVELFSSDCIKLGQCSQPGHCAASGVGKWLEEKSREENLSLRQMATKVGVSHQTIAGLMSGKKALPETIKKMAKAFGGNSKQRLALEDKLLILAGYRTERPSEKLNELLAQLLDKVKDFDELELDMMLDHADYIVKIEEKLRQRER